LEAYKKAMKIKNSVSFNVDHSRLTRGIYLSKIDFFGGIKTITFDLRLRVPYEEKVISNSELHTFEHCFATAVRNVAENTENLQISYFGPMGCQTGYYLVVNTDIDESQYYNVFCSLLEKACEYVLEMTEVPAKNKLQCGNCYSLGTIDDAKASAKELLKLVYEMKEQQDFHKYSFIED